MSDDLDPLPPAGRKGSHPPSPVSADKAFCWAALVWVPISIWLFSWMSHSLEWRAWVCLLLVGLMILGWLGTGWQKFHGRSPSTLMAAAWSLSVGLSISAFAVVFIAPRAFLAPARFFENLFMAGVPIGLAHFFWKRSRPPVGRREPMGPVTEGPPGSPSANRQAIARPDAKVPPVPDFFVIGFFAGMLLFGILISPYDELAGPFQGNGFGGRSPTPYQNHLRLLFALAVWAFTAVSAFLLIRIKANKSFFKGLVAGCSALVLWNFCVVFFNL